VVTRKLEGGYTLVELLVVMAILGTLAVMAWPMAVVTVQRERERDLRRALWEVRDAIDAYHRAVVAGAIPVRPGAPGFPAHLSDLVEAYPDARPGHRGEVLRFLRRVPRDPFAPSALPAEQTWRLRSFFSSAEKPVPGDDVYDIASSSDDMALSGVALKDW
jgi:general secretion pathway protein G